MDEAEVEYTMGKNKEGDYKLSVMKMTRPIVLKTFTDHNSPELK